MKTKKTTAKKPTTKKTTTKNSTASAKKSAVTTKKKSAAATKKSTTKATVNARGPKATSNSSAKNRGQATLSSATKRNTKKSAVKAATPAKNSVKQATTTKLKTKAAQAASQNPKIKVGDTVLSIETGNVGGIREIKTKKNANKKPTPHAVIHWASIDGVSDKPLIIEVSELKRMRKDGTMKIFDHSDKPKASVTKAVPAKTTIKPTSNQKPAANKAPSKLTTSSKPVKQTAKRTSTAKKSNEQLVTVEIRIHEDAKAGHPHIMVDTVGDNNVSVGTTHDKFKGKNHPNIALERNPLGGKEKTYIRRQGTVDRKENYSATKKTGKITAADHTKVKQIGAKAKEKHLEQQNKKR